MADEAPRTLDDAAASQTVAGLGVTLPTSRGPAVQRGALVSRYVVLSKLGAGAMGEVFAAYDPELDRKVALKLLKAQDDGRSSARSRLQREAQALAKLDHRNVVAVHDVGVHEGQLFVGMEFVAGKTLGEWRAEVEGPRAWREVLRVFTEAGRGLAAAHAAGLVHRDFKPDNVMLGADGRVRVMDFGLARAEDEELEREAAELESAPELRASKQMLVSPLTQTGTMLGTPAYMSIEQFEGKPADARSDQFSFCVALYEVLYGERPFAGATIGALVRAVSGGELRPAPRGTAVPAWLRKVVLRGLSPEPSERWPSMQALLEALADDPAARRRKWWAAALLGVLASGAGGLVFAYAQDVQTCERMDRHLEGVWDEGRRAEVQAALEATGLNYAAQTWTRVEQRLDDYAGRWVAAREQACEATLGGEQSGELLDLRMACLDERLQHLRATVEVLAAADETVLTKAVEAVANLPSLARCADVEALTAELPPPEDPEVARRVAALEERLVKAAALEEVGKFGESLKLTDAAVAEAAQLDYEPLRARAWLLQGSLQMSMGEYQAAEATLGLAYDTALGLGMTFEAAEGARQLIWVLGYGLARPEDGRRWAKHAEPLTRAADTELGRANYLNNLGVIAEAEGKLEEARDHHERALSIFEQALGVEHPGIAASLLNLGIVAEAQGEYEQARDYYERGLAIYEEAMGPKHPHVANALNNLGDVAHTQGNHAQSRGYYERALTISEQALGPKHPSVAQSLNNLGLVAVSQGNYEQARDALERAVSIFEKARGPEHPHLAVTLSSLGNVAYAEHDYEQAGAHFERALAIFEKVMGPEHPNLAAIHNNLGNVARKRDEYEQARVHYERALVIWEQSLGPEHPNLAFALTGLGLALMALDRSVDAGPALERALALRTANAVNPESIAETQFALAQALWGPARAQDRDRAQRLAEQARSTFAQAGERADTELAQVEAWQAEHSQR